MVTVSKVMRVGDHIPPGVYKVVCTGHECFTSRSGIEGISIPFEVLEPSRIKNPSSGRTIKTRGKVVEHCMWLTEKSAPYAQRDARRICRGPVKHLKQIVWIGKTCEINVEDQVFRNLKRSCVTSIRSWKPKNDSTTRPKVTPVSQTR